MANRTFRLKPIVAAITAAMATGALGLPTTPTVTSGTATFNQSGSTLTVTNSPSAIINWGSFSIGQNETTRFVQQSSTSAVLNRVVGQDPSQILGSLQSNGRVFLINPNGVLFGQGARIDTAGLIASSLALSDADFLSGKLAFSGTGTEGKVVNAGTISTSSGAAVYLIAPNVENSGVIHAPNGDILLAAGSSVEIADAANPALRVLLTAPEGEAINLGQLIAESGSIGLHGGVVSNHGTLNASSAVAEGGRIYLRGTTIDLAGTLKADGAIQGGSVAADGEVIFQTAAISASGTSGGDVTLSANRVLQAGKIDARGQTGNGGNIAVSGTTAVIQTIAGELDASANGDAGTIRIQSANGSAFLSGKATATGNSGGRIELLGRSVVLSAAAIDASGNTQGGTVLVGGDFQGSNPAVQNAENTNVNSTTRIDVSAGEYGNGGKAIVWSDQSTLFGGTIAARGADAGGNGGFVEVSGKENLAFGGVVDAGANNGAAGTLLLDPKNITIDANAGGGASYTSLADPNPATGDGYGGSQIVELSNGNIVVASPGDDFGATDAGAVFLFNGSSGALISALYGSATNDQVGKGGDNASALGIVTLSNGHFLVSSPNWDNGGTVDAGAVTWASSTLGVSGAVSSGNSLVGGTAGDRIGSAGVTALAGNGNYVVSSPFWDNTSTDVGAATLVSGAAAVTGQISAATSLIGSAANDQVGRGGATALTNGNYVVSSSSWGGGKGAATWRSGIDFTGTTVSTGNSLYGRLSNDLIGGGITVLPNGNYLVSSSLWDYDDGSFLGAINAGAVTWVNGSNGNLVTGTPGGEVSDANSLVGSSSLDGVGGAAPVVLPSGNYVVSTSSWRDGSNTVGAVTWGNGTNGTFGFISSSNSVIGNSDGDSARLGGVLSNGNYVVISPSWDSPTLSDVGAVTWVNGTNGQLATGTTGGVISASNSLVGSHAGDRIGDFGIVSLPVNGNYVIRSPSWDNGVSANVGAASWGNGSTGTVGVVSSSNSVVGSTTNDQVGFIVYPLSNGNYVVRSSEWDNGGIVDAGAATWVNGTNGQLVTGATGGAISAANSLVGGSAGDRVGLNITPLVGNGNYVVGSPDWDNGGTANVGATTWVNGATGTAGVVSAGNSLVGVVADDAVGQSVVALSNGNFVIRSANWDNGGVVDAGAVTWGHGSAGITGAVSASNSLVGTTAGDKVGINGITVLTDGNFVVRSYFWDNAGTGVTDARAITWGNGASGTVGSVNTTNSLTGISAADQIGSGGITTLSDGRFVVSSPLWNGGEGRLHIGSAVIGTGTIGGASFANTGDSGVNYTLTPSSLLATLNSGTALALQANNDITITSPIAVSNASGNGGTLTLQAGRSILLNANISTDNGNLVLSANDPAASLANRDAGTANITLASGVTLDTGTGALSATIGALSPSEIGVFTNAGTISTSSGSITADFSNTGTFTLAGGTLDLVRGVSNSGLFSNSGVFTLSGTGTIRLANSGNGYPTFSNATGGTLNLNTASGGWSFLSDSGTQGGILNNAGTINVNTSYTSWEAAFSNAGTGTLNIAAGNAVSMQNGQSLQGTVNLGAGSTLWVSERHGSNALFSGTTIGGTGIVQVAGGAGPVADFNNVSASAATLLVAGGGTANILGPTSFANLTQNGGSLTGAGTLTLSGTMNQTGGAQSGPGDTVLPAGATATLTGVTNTRGINNQGTLNLAGALLSGNLSNTGTLNVNSASNTLSGTFSQAGIVNVASGATLQKAGGMTNDGQILGTGNIDLGGAGNSLINNGTLRPGSSPGTLTINGDLVLNSTGVLVAELGGSGQGTTYDWLNITGSATLGGTLQATLFGAYAPTVGTIFDLISAGTAISGNFGSIALPAGYSFSANYGSTVFGLNVTGVAAATPTPSGGLNSLLSNINSTITLAALSYETPILYSSGQSSSTASGSGVNNQTAELVLPSLMPPPAENALDAGPMSATASALIPVMNQLLLDANIQEQNNESRLICR